MCRLGSASRGMALLQVKDSVHCCCNSAAISANVFQPAALVDALCMHHAVMSPTVDHYRLKDLEQHPNPCLPQGGRKQCHRNRGSISLKLSFSSRGSLRIIISVSAWRKDTVQRPAAESRSKCWTV